MRTKLRRLSLVPLYQFTFATVCVVLSGAIAAASPRWERANAVGQAQGVAIAVCLPFSEIVCKSFGSKIQMNEFSLDKHMRRSIR